MIGTRLIYIVIIRDLVAGENKDCDGLSITREWNVESSRLSRKSALPTQELVI